MSMFRNLMSTPIPTESGPDTFICKIKNTENSAVTPYIAFPVRNAYAGIPSITATIETSGGQSQTLTITGTDLTTKNDTATFALGRIDYFSAVSMAQDETATVTLYSKSKQFPSFSFCSSTDGYSWGKANAKLYEVNTPLPVFVDGFCGSVFVGSLLTSLPGNLFQYGDSIKELNSTFAYSSLVTVPADLFSGMSKVTKVYQLFNNSDKLVTLPEGLFSGMPEVTDLNRCFNHCSALPSIPAGLFNGMTEVTNLDNVFNGCRKLASIPAGLFNGMTKVKSLIALFANCSSLVSIPVGLFREQINATDFRYCFRYVPARAIHANIFCDEATEKATRFANVGPNFTQCFADLKGKVAGTVPALWEYTYKATPTKTKCFNGNSTTTLSNYGDIPTEWK